MMARCLTILAALLALSASGALLCAQEGPVPRELAADLEAARELLAEGRPADAADRLQRYDGPDHIVRHLLVGQAYSEAGEPGRAEAAFRRALELEPEREDAWKGLARALMDQQDWPAARRALGRGVDVRADDAEWLLAYADVSRRLEDSRLTRVLVDTAISRFPQDLRFRRLDLELLLNAGSPAAVSAAEHLVSAEPDSPRAWQWLARAYRQSGDDVSARAAQHAGLLSEDADPSARLAYLQARLAAGDWLTVVERGQELMQGPEADRWQGDLQVMEALVAAAEQGGRDSLVSQWLADVPAEQRTPLMRTVGARLHLRQGRHAEAFRALTDLIEQGAATASSYMSAAYAAAESGKFEQADALYREAQAMGGAAASAAPLYRARLYHRQGYEGRARTVLREHLAQQPTDTAARAYLRLLDDSAAQDPG